MNASRGQDTGIGLVDRAKAHGSRVALLSGGRTHSYLDLLQTSETVAGHLLGKARDLKEERAKYIRPYLTDAQKILLEEFLEMEDRELDLLIRKLRKQ